MSNEHPWRDKETLWELYHDEEMSLAEIGSQLGCSAKSIERWMRKYNIPRRDEGTKYANRRETKPYASYDVEIRGYPRWQDPSQKSIVRVHRLLAISEYGVEEVVQNDVHHKNGVPWDNRPENIELLSHSEHGQLHATEGNHV